MAYTPINWQNGDTITAEKMNKMDNGWGLQETQLFSETVTTTAGQTGNSAVLSYAGTTLPDSMGITFDGTEYTCSVQSSNTQYWYGAPNPSDWSTYPFVLLYTNQQWRLITQTAGTHTISASAEIVEVSSTFCNAVGKALVVPIFTEADGEFTCNMTYSEVRTAIDGGVCFYSLFDDFIYTVLASGSTISFSQIYVDDANSVTQEKINYHSNGYIELVTNTYPSN